MSTKHDDFRKAVEGLINEFSMENGSGTPDYVLATYLSDCLKAYDAALVERERWYGRTPNGGPLPKV